MRGELWRLADGNIARVMLVTVCTDERLSFAFVERLMTERNVPLQAFLPPAYRIEQPELW